MYGRYSIYSCVNCAFSFVWPSTSRAKTYTIFPRMQKYHDFQWKLENFVQNLGGEGYYFKLCIAIGQW
jgi:hypothetical protein